MNGNYRSLALDNISISAARTDLKHEPWVQDSAAFTYSFVFFLKFFFQVTKENPKPHFVGVSLVLVVPISCKKRLFV